MGRKPAIILTTSMVVCTLLHVGAVQRQLAYVQLSLSSSLPRKPKRHQFQD